MQLILEAEAIADISVEMSTVEESLSTNLKDSIESLKNDICNGNNENIECQKNVLTNSVDDINSDNKGNSDNDQPGMPSAAQDTKIELEINNGDHPNSPPTVEDAKSELETKIDNAREAVSSNGNSYGNSNSNGVHNTDINGDGQKCKENSALEKKESEAENILVNDTVKQETQEISLSAREDNSKNTEMELDNIETENKLDNLENPLEFVKNKTLPMADQVDEDISEMALEVDKTISEMAMQVDEDILEDVDPVVLNISEEAIKIDEVESDKVSPKTESAPENLESERNVDILSENLDLEKADDNNSVEVVPVASEESKTQTVVISEQIDNKELKNVVPITSEQELKNIVSVSAEQGLDNVVLVTSEQELENAVPVTSEQSETKPTAKGEKSDDNKPGIVVLVTSDKSEAQTKTGEKSDDNKTGTVVLDASEPNEAEAVAIGELETEKKDDDIIQIESKHDSEVLENVCEETEKKIVDVPQKIAQNVTDIDTLTEVHTSKTVAKESSENKSDKIDCDLVEDKPIQSTDYKVEVLDEDELKEISEVKETQEEPKVIHSQSDKAVEPKKILKLSNTLNILSDEEEDQPQTELKKTAETTNTEKQCINIEDDDDIMLIDEDTDLSKDSKTEQVQPMSTEEKKEEKPGKCTVDLEKKKEESIETKVVDVTVAVAEKDPEVKIPEVNSPIKDLDTTETIKEAKKELKVPPKPLLPENFLKSCKKNLADMTRDELEEFCVLKIVESIVDRSNLGEIKSKLKSMGQNIEEHKKKAMMLTKQNRDLQLVLKSVQEEQKKKPDTAITPLKITRSVGMQVLMTEKIGARKKSNNNISLAPPNANRGIRTPNQGPRAPKAAAIQQIPVPRLVPAAANPVAKSPITQNSPVNTQVKTANQFNGARMSPPVQKAEKRPHNRLQSVTVDLTDDEPPTKVTPRSSPAPPVRLVSPQNLMSNPRPQLTTAINSPRKVYIPISGPQGQNIRPGQTIMLKSVPTSGPRQRSVVPNIPRGPAPNVIKRVQNNRHPAPLPDAMKQYQPPNWKALPPAPDLKLSKVENGIVISWKIEGYQEDSYEEIASYQLYAYQETSSPPSTSLWKKIGDVKALPLPMACTLTQFMAGFKYYFAVRAVDIRSRLGPFSLPGSILLLNKM